jgi:hypothetical protein
VGFRYFTAQTTSGIVLRMSASIRRTTLWCSGLTWSSHASTAGRPSDGAMWLEPEAFFVPVGLEAPRPRLASDFFI